MGIIPLFLIGFAGGAAASAAAQAVCRRRMSVLEAEDASELAREGGPSLEWVAAATRGAATGSTSPETCAELVRRGLAPEGTRADELKYSMRLSSGRPRWVALAAPFGVACGAVAAGTGSLAMAASAACALVLAVADYQLRWICPQAAVAMALVACAARGASAPAAAAAAGALALGLALFRRAAAARGGAFGTGDVLLMASIAVSCWGSAPLFAFSVALAAEMAGALAWMKVKDKDTLVPLAAFTAAPYLIACFF